MVGGMVDDAFYDPCPYNYGSNIVYEGDTVYVNGVPYVGADQYYQQAQDIANAGSGDTVAGAAPVTTNVTVENTTTEPTAPSSLAPSADLAGAGSTTKPEDPAAQPEDGWLPMGTFAIVADNDQKESNRILQIATNKQGLVRGNLIDRDTDQSVELYGSVDPKTQRVAFKTRGNDEVVGECGLWNLTQDTVPMLVHVNNDKTEERTLIRLKNDDAKAKPEETSKAGSPSL